MVGIRSPDGLVVGLAPATLEFWVTDSSEWMNPFRASTRAGLTRVRSLNTWVYSERNAVTHLPDLFPSLWASCEQESVVSKNQEEKRKFSRERLLSEVNYRFRENAPFSVLRPQNALKNPSPEAFEVLRIALPLARISQR
jgi:hypothetical protein